MRVLLSPPLYNVSMSSTIGLALVAVAESPPGMKVRYRWRANAGFFLSQDEASAEIRNAGREAKTDDMKLFWSYDPNEPAAVEKRAIGITVITENAKNNRAVTRTDITLVWDGDSVRAVH